MSTVDAIVCIDSIRRSESIEKGFGRGVTSLAKISLTRLLYVKVQADHRPSQLVVSTEFPPRDSCHGSANHQDDRHQGCATGELKALNFISWHDLRTLIFFAEFPATDISSLGNQLQQFVVYIF